MKASRAEIERAAAKRPATLRAVLLCGPDEATSRELASALVAAWSDPTDQLSRVELTAATLADDPSRLADEAAAIGMFGGGRVIVAHGVQEAALEAMQLLIAGPSGDPAVLTAGELRKTSKLRQWAETTPGVLALTSYPLDGRAAEDAAMARARALGLSAESDAIRRLLQLTNSDTGLLARELEKAALYVDATPGESRPLTTADVAAIGAGHVEPDFGALAIAVAAGRPDDAAREVAAFARGGASAIGALRTVQKRFIAMADVTAGLSGGGPPREAASAQAQARRWDGKLDAALDALLDAERACKSSGNPGDVLGFHALIELAIAGAR